MQQIERLARMTQIASTGAPRAALDEMRALLREGLGARDVAVVFADEGEGFARLCDEPLPDNNALWVIHRKLTDAGRPLSFRFEQDRARGFAPLEGARDLTAFAARPSATMLGAEMIVVRGDWPGGVPDDAMRFFDAALAPFAIALQRSLEARRSAQQHEQVSALGSIARLISDNDSIEDVLRELCTIIAGVSGMTSVTIDVYEAASGAMVRRAINNMGAATAQGERWVAAVRKPNPIQVEAFRTGEPVLMQDIQNDPRIDERARAFFRAALIRSAAVVPLIVKGEAVGCMSYASNLPQTFENIAYLVDLASQAAMTIRGIQMYHELAESRHHLAALNEKLLDSMRSEHLLARTDALTGIPNRRYIDEVLNAECERAHREGSPLSVAMADVDHFKQINDTYGHDAGDEVLRQLGALAREAAGARHIAARYGGDELVFVMPALTLPRATDAALAWNERVASQDFWVDRQHHTSVTVSIGVAEGHASGARSPEDLLRLADAALYDAKRAGRNRVMVFEGGEADERVA
ncbi:MAG: sensor domain-containing diguanylate cyclase [Dehalococcoidia bacterium]